MKFVPAIGLAILLLHLAPHSEKWRPLFNGKDLGGWETFLGPGFDSEGKKMSATPAGLNNDPQKVFTVVSLDGEKVIRISGEYLEPLLQRRNTTIITCS